MIENPLENEVTQEMDNNYLSEQFYENCRDTAHDVAKRFSLKSELYDDFTEFYTDLCSESDDGYSLINDKTLIEDWWDKNKYIYETKTPYQETK